MRGGMFWGWPSSHTTVAFAMAAAICKLYPENRLLRYAAILYAGYVGIGISMTIHWFSEFVAGVIIGSVIGAVVGKSFHHHSAIVGTESAGAIAADSFSSGNSPFSQSRGNWRVRP